MYNTHIYLSINFTLAALHLPDGSRDIRELLVVLPLHMCSEQQKMAWWKDGAVEQCKRIFCCPFKQPCSNTIPLLRTWTEEKHRVPWQRVTWGHVGLSHRHTSCPSVEEMIRVQHTLTRAVFSHNIKTHSHWIYIGQAAKRKTCVSQTLSLTHKLCTTWHSTGAKGAYHLKEKQALQVNYFTLSKL